MHQHFSLITKSAPLYTSCTKNYLKDSVHAVKNTRRILLQNLNL